MIRAIRVLRVLTRTSRKRKTLNHEGTKGHGPLPKGRRDRCNEGKRKILKALPLPAPASGQGGKFSCFLPVLPAPACPGQRTVQGTADTGGRRSGQGARI